MFSLILADPPWKYDHVRTKSRAVENHYPTMTVEQIAALRVADIAAPDAILFLWATNPKLLEALRVMDAWGFKYRTNAAWDKEKMGMGYYFRGQHELLLVGIRGKMRPPPPNTRPRSIIRSPRSKHSQKPPIHGMLEKMYPAATKVELFAREPVAGWAVWGDEVASDVRVEAA